MGNGTHHTHVNLTAHLNLSHRVITWILKPCVRQNTHDTPPPPTTIISSSITYTQTKNNKMEKDYSSDRTITNTVNKSVRDDDVTRRIKAVEMYQRRRGFFVGYFHKFRHHIYPIHSTFILQLSLYSLTNSHSTLNFVGRRETKEERLKRRQREYRQRREYYKKNRRKKLSKLSIIAREEQLFCVFVLGFPAPRSRLRFRVFSNDETSLFTASTQAGFLIFALYSSYINWLENTSYITS